MFFTQIIKKIMFLLITLACVNACATSVYKLTDLESFIFKPLNEAVRFLIIGGSECKINGSSSFNYVCTKHIDKTIYREIHLHAFDSHPKIKGQIIGVSLSLRQRIDEGTFLSDTIYPSVMKSEFGKYLPNAFFVGYAKSNHGLPETVMPSSFSLKNLNKKFTYFPYYWNTGSRVKVTSQCKKSKIHHPSGHVLNINKIGSVSAYFGSKPSLRASCFRKLSVGSGNNLKIQITFYVDTTVNGKNDEDALVRLMYGFDKKVDSGLFQ